MYTHNLNPIILKLGPLQIRWYGVIFVLGFISAYFLINYLVKLKKINLSKEDVSDLVLYLLLGAIVGSRIFYILFYNFPYYLQNPLNIFAVWQGGLSFHGGLVGAIIAGIYYCKKHQIHPYVLADICMIPLAFGLIFGRLGNFINGELVGRVTNVSWCINYPNLEGCRHPSQLYESFKNLVIFTTLFSLRNKQFKSGTIFYLFILMYGILRFIIGFYRAPDPQLGFIIFNLTMGQLLNIGMIMVGGVMIYRVNRKSLKDNNSTI